MRAVCRIYVFGWCGDGSTTCSSSNSSSEMWRFDMESYNINLQVRKLTCKNSFSQEMFVSFCFYVLWLQTETYYQIFVWFHEALLAKAIGPNIIVPYGTSYLPSSTQSMGNNLQCEAPKIAKLVYNSNDYCLWYL